MRCKACKEADYETVGVGEYDDTVEVECPSCGDCQEVEPDGLGMGGMEWVEAKMRQYEKNNRVPV